MDRVGTVVVARVRGVECLTTVRGFGATAGLGALSARITTAGRAT